MIGEVVMRSIGIEYDLKVTREIEYLQPRNYLDMRLSVLVYP